MAEIKKNPDVAAELNNEELHTVADGKAGYLQRSGPIYDNKGRKVGYNFSYWADIWKEQEIDNISYRPCSKCHGPMHQGKMPLWYCDPCNNLQVRPIVVFFKGSLSEFMELANR